MSGSRLDDRPVGQRISFVPTVQLSKSEAFAACQVLADADRVLVRAGSLVEARALGDLFELFEARLTAEERSVQAPSGSKSRDNEFTQ